MMTSLPMHRARARVLCLDDSGRVLLFHLDGESFGTADERVWCTPGDVVEDAETGVDVAVRVAHRHLGLEIDHDELGSVVAASSGMVFTPDGTQLRATDSYFVLTASPGDDRLDEAETAETKERRWWTADEIDASDETIVPAGLADLIRRLASGQEMVHPIRLPHREAPAP